MFGVTKQAYYKHGDHLLTYGILSSFVVRWVRDYREFHPGVGGEKLWYAYKAYFGDGYRVGRDAFLDILRLHGLLLRKRTRRCRTTDSTHCYPLYPNLIEEVVPLRVNQIWVVDITYIKLSDGGFCFLSLVTDAYSRQIKGWSLGPDLTTRYPLEALRQAYDTLPDGFSQSLIHHSDRGSQYASYEYTGLLTSRKTLISMTQNGDPKENAIAERVNGILKREYLLPAYPSPEQAGQAVGQAVEHYNGKRLHRSLDMLTPDQAAGKTGEIKKRWRSPKDKYRTGAMVST